MPDTSGRSSLTPFAFYDPDSSSWRTSQGTFPWDSTPSSVILPPSGSMRSGALFERPTSAPATDAPDSSSLLGTPNAHERTHSPRQVDHGVQLANQVAALLPTPAVNDMGEGKTPEAWDEWTDKMRAKHGNGNGNGRSLAIEAQRLLPTPVVTDANGARNSTARRRADSTGNIGDTLTDAVWKQHGAPEWGKTNLLPTPTARDGKGSDAPGREGGRSLPELMRSHGATTPPPSPDTPPPSDDPHPTLWTTEDD